MDYALAGCADVLGQLGLSHRVFDEDPAVGLNAEALGQFEQRQRDPTGNVVVMQVFQGVVGPAQALRKDPQQM